MRNYTLVLLTFLAAAPARAWAPAGHRAIAVLAEKRLNPRAAAEVKRILQVDANLGDIANCADGIIYGPVHCGGFDILQRADTASWHFINIPIGLKPGELASYCHRVPGSAMGTCLVDRVKQQIEVLADKNALLDDRRLALVFVVHLMGDLHQPLHVADDDDWGGNKKPVSFEGWKANLHKLWDNSVSESSLRDDINRFAPGSDARGQYWVYREEYTGQTYADELRWTAWTDSERPTLRGNAYEVVDQAAWETYAMGRDMVYLPFYKGGSNDLGPDYQAKMQPLARRQVSRAAERLAFVLNWSLSEAGPREGVTRLVNLDASRFAPLLRDPWTPAP
jgi:hypothetical protein